MKSEAGSQRERDSSQVKSQAESTRTMAVHWHQSKRFRIAAGVLLLLLVGLLLVPFLVPVDRFRPAVVELLEQQTGRDIEIESIRLHLLPKLHLEVESFRVKNPRGFPEGDTLIVDQIDLGVPLGPLLRRQVEVESLSLRGATINLLEGQRGRSNADLGKLHHSAPREKDAPEKEPLFSLSRVDVVELRDLSLSSGTFHSRRKRVHPSFVIRGIDLALRGMDLSDPQWQDKLEAELDLRGIEISAPSLNQPLRFADGTLKMRGLSAESRFTLALGPVRARGEVTIANLKRPRADFTMTIQELNVAELSALVAGGEEGTRSPGSSGGTQRRLLARGTVQVDNLLMEPFAAENATGKVRLYTHKLEVEPLGVDFYGGRVEGALNVDRRQESLPSSLTVKVQGVDVARLAAATQGGTESKITGTFDAQAGLKTSLGGDPLAGLTGQGEFSVRDGILRAFKLEGKRAAMASLLQMDVPSGDTPFRYFGGDLRVDKQRVHSRKLSLDSDRMEAALSGSFGFDGTLNYTGTGVLHGGATEQQEPQAQEEAPQRGNPLAAIGRAFGRAVQQTIGRMRVPISITGTFAAPRFRLAGVPEPIEQSQEQTEASQQDQQEKNLLNLLRRRP